MPINLDRDQAPATTRLARLAAAVLSTGAQHPRSRDDHLLLEMGPTALPDLTLELGEGSARSPGRAIRILLLESNSADHDAIATLIHDALEGRCQVDRASDAKLALDLIVQDAHDLYLVGLGGSVTDALILIRAAAECRGPVVALIDSADAELEFLALSAGATDCVARRGDSRDALRRSIRHAIVRQHTGWRGAKHAPLEREESRLNALQDVSHRLARRSCHDIRSPLSVIKTYSSILLSELATNIDEDQARFLRTIMRRVDDVATMLDGMLDASQLASDLVGSHREATSVEALVEELRPALEQTAAACEAELRVTMDASLPHIFCDRGNVGRVIHDLAARACKAAGQGGRVELWARCEPAEKSVRIGVTDNRPPPPKEVDDLIYDPGYQPEPKPIKAEGSELRLHVIRELVRINLGTFVVTTPPEGGSTSDFTVPLVDIDRILSSHLGVLASGRQTVSALSLVLATTAPPQNDEHAGAIVEFLWSELRACDLVVPLGPGVWALCVSSNAGDVEAIVRRVQDSLHARNERRPEDPLPAISHTILGTWPLSASAEEIASTLRRSPASHLFHEE